MKAGQAVRVDNAELKPRRGDVSMVAAKLGDRVRCPTRSHGPAPGGDRPPRPPHTRVTRSTFPRADPHTAPTRRGHPSCNRHRRFLLHPNSPPTILPTRRPSRHRPVRGLPGFESESHRSSCSNSFVAQVDGRRIQRDPNFPEFADRYAVRPADTHAIGQGGRPLQVGDAGFRVVRPNTVVQRFSCILPESPRLRARWPSDSGRTRRQLSLTAPIYAIGHSIRSRHAGKLDSRIRGDSIQASTTLPTARPNGSARHLIWRESRLHGEPPT